MQESHILINFIKLEEFIINYSKEDNILIYLDFIENQIIFLVEILIKTIKIRPFNIHNILNLIINLHLNLKNNILFK